MAEMKRKNFQLTNCENQKKNLTNTTKRRRVIKICKY